MTGCYCVCHSSVSSRAWCEHCHGNNAVGRVPRCMVPDRSNAYGTCAQPLPCPIHNVHVQVIPASVVELADTADSRPAAFGCGGSTPPRRTMKTRTRKIIVFAVAGLAGGVIGFLSDVFDWTLSEVYIASIVTITVVVGVGLPWVFHPASGSRNTRPS